MVRRFIERLKAKGKFPTLPSGTVNPIIVTGFAALGRGHELNKLRAYFADGQALYGEGFMAEFDAVAVADVLATHHNVDVQGLKKTPEAKQAEAAQQQQANMMDKATGPVAGEAMKGFNERQSQ